MLASCVQLFCSPKKKGGSILESCPMQRLNEEKIKGKVGKLRRQFSSVLQLFGRRADSAINFQFLFFYLANCLLCGMPVGDHV